jgi:beta-lactamase regulating signal transducer with metallopeptidase domain
MNALATVGSAPIVQAVGLALIHFSWQGFLLGSLLSLILIAMRERSPNARYAVCLSTMLLMLLAPIVTTAVIVSAIPHPLHRATDSVLLLQERTLGTGWIVPLLPWLTGFWALGTSFLQLRLIVDWMRARRIQRVGVRFLPEEWLRELHELRARLGICKAVRILESSLVSVPSVIGWSRPLILIPAGILSTLTPPQLRAVIAHELAHIRRHDYVVNLLQNVFESILFFHPMTWWVSERLRAEREYCCDDVAVSTCGSLVNYAQALSSLEEFRGREGRGALASTGGNLMQRISRMLESRGTISAGRASWLPLVLSLAGVVAMVAVVATGCDSEGIGGAGVADAVVGPAVAAVEPTNTVSDPDLPPVVARLEECCEGGTMTADQLQESLEQLRTMAAAGNVVCDVKGDGGACRVVIRAPGTSNASCCEGGAPAFRIRPGESLQDCIRRSIKSTEGGYPAE